MSKLLNLEVKEFYAIRLEHSSEEQFCYCSEKTVHNKYSHSYFMITENKHNESSIHDCGSYYSDYGYCNIGKNSPMWPNGGISECRKLTDDEVYKFKYKLNRFNKVNKK